MENNEIADREMLELAAKAAGLNFDWNYKYDCAKVWDDGDKKRTFWSPLLCDGDAMRLRGKIGASIADEGSSVRVEIHKYQNSSVIIEAYDRDLPGGFSSCYSVNKATRLAIIKAAAEIGKRMA